LRPRGARQQRKGAARRPDQCNPAQPSAGSGRARYRGPKSPPPARGRALPSPARMAPDCPRRGPHVDPRPFTASAAESVAAPSLSFGHASRIPQPLSTAEECGRSAASTSGLKAHEFGRASPCSRPRYVMATPNRVWQSDRKFSASRFFRHGPVLTISRVEAYIRRSRRADALGVAARLRSSSLKLGGPASDHRRNRGASVGSLAGEGRMWSRAV
jgi:hypothetical protein